MWILKVLNHRFWVWLDRKLITHRIREDIDKTMRQAVEKVGNDVDEITKEFLSHDYSGLEGIVDDSTDVAEYDEVVVKGYEQS